MLATCVTQSVFNLSKVIAIPHRVGSVGPKKRPLCVDIVIGHDAKGSECNSVISTFIAHISSVAINVAQSKRKTYLSQ